MTLRLTIGRVSFPLRKIFGSFNTSSISIFNQNEISRKLINNTFVNYIHYSRNLFSKNIVTIQDEDDWETIITKSKVPVIVDFYADWCGPCKLLAPRLESKIAKRVDDVILAKVNIDNFTDLAIEHGVEAVPAVIAMKNGKQIDSFIGLKDDVEIETFINKVCNT